MDQTLHQIGSLLLFQLKILCVSTFFSLELGFSIIGSWFTRWYTNFRNSDQNQPRGTEENDTHGAEAQDWVVIGNAERQEAQARASRRKKVGCKTYSMELSRAMTTLSRLTG